MDYAYGIIASINFDIFPHEPRLYVGKVQGQTLIFLRQVDDFTIASPSPELANSFLEMIDNHLKRKLKLQDLLSSLNGLRAQQC